MKVNKGSPSTKEKSIGTGASSGKGIKSYYRGKKSYQR